MKLSSLNGFTVFSHHGCGSSRLRCTGFYLTYVYLCLSLLVKPDRCAEACQFPDYVQNSVNGSDNMRDWNGQIRNQNREVMLKYEFKKDVLRTNSTDPSINSHSRICIQSYENDKYLMAHEEPGQISGLFVCVQILKRSDFVIQLKQSEMSNSISSNLCSDENLSLDGWLIIDTKSVMNQRVDCSLNGGFNMRIYDKSSYTSVCDGYLGETRLESECLPGEGLNFYFRTAPCVPDSLYMYPTQRTYCLANWNDEGFNFILLKHDRMTSMWVLRYPSSMHGEQDEMQKFTALLMKDLYATNENSIAATNQYLRLTMSRQSPKTLDHLCYDDYEICSVLSDPCSYSEDIARTCAKTCGFCSETKPAVCQLDSSIQGTWVNSNHPDDIPDIRINATSVHISGTETLHCIDWTNETLESTETFSMGADIPRKQMVVTVSDNGCRPRFSCVEFKKLTNSLFVKFSHTRLWPLVKRRLDNYTCNDFLYTNNKDIDKNPYRKRLSSLLVPNTMEPNITVNLREFENFDVRFKGRVMCSGRLAQGLQNKTVQFYLENCQEKSLENIEFTFVEFTPLPFPSPDNDMLLITRTNNTTPITHCWLFPEKTNDVFHMVASEDCNGAMKRKIRKGRLHPIATFRKAVPWILITENNTVITETTENNLGSTIQNKNTDPDLGPNVITKVMNDPDNSQSTSTEETNTTLVDATIEGEIRKPSIFVIFGVIISFITVQVGIYCNCSC